jgi:Na+/melibiose symporter-like transporter
MWTMQVVRMALMAVLTAVILADLGSTAMLWTLYVVSFFLGTGEVLFDNAAQAIMPAVVRKNQLQVANGRLYSVEEATNRFAGPPVGSFLFAAAAALPFIVDAASFGVGAVLIFSMTGSYAPARAGSPASTSIRLEIGEGLKWLLQHRILRTLAVMTGVSNLTHSATYAIFVLYALEILHLSERGFGVILAASAIGGLVGGLVAPRLARFFGDGKSFYIITISAAVAELVIGLTSNAVIVAVAMIAFGLGAMWWNVIAVSLRQSIVPDQLLGRVNSVYRLLAWGTMPLGAAVGGILGRAFGLRAAYFFSAAVLALLTLYMLPIVSDRTIAAARAEAE